MTLYVPDADLMIYHVPKCGGTWVREALRQWVIKASARRVPGVSIQHATPSHFPGHKGPQLVFIREPVSWYSSWFRYQEANDWPVWEDGLWHPCRAVEGNPSRLGFADWIDQTLDYDSPLTDIYERYLGPLDQIALGTGGIGLLESIQSGLSNELFLRRLTPKLVDVPPVHVTPSMAIQDEIDKVCLSIRNAESRIYDRFGEWWDRFE